MVAGTSEKLAQAEEQVKQPSETKQPPPASNVKAQPSETAGKAKENKPFDFDSPEFKAAVEKHAYSLAQSMKDKEVTPLREKLKGYEDKETEAEAERQLKIESEAWESDGAEPQAIRSIQDAHRKNIADRKDIMKLASEHQTLLARATRAEAILDYVEALGINLPQDKIDHLIKESEGSPKLRKLLAAQITAELKKTTEKKVEVEEGPEQPDSSAHSAPGGIDLDNLSPKEKIEYGLAHPRKK